MEQLQGIDIVLHLDGGALKLQGVVHQVLQCIQINIIAKEGTRHVEGDILELHLRHVAEKLLGQLMNHFGHVESAVFGQSFHHGLAQVSHRGFSIRAIVFHILIDFHKFLHKLLEAQETVAPRDT